MGVFDMAKMAQKAMQAKKQMSKIQAAGKAGSLGVLIDGLYNVVEVEVDRDILKSELGIELDDNALDKIAKSMEKNVKDSFSNAKKSLEKELANSTNLDDLKNLLS
jgi:DNA-binding protein YbaB